MDLLESYVLGTCIAVGRWPHQERSPEPAGLHSCRTCQRSCKAQCDAWQGKVAAHAFRELRLARLERFDRYAEPRRGSLASRALHQPMLVPAWHLTESRDVQPVHPALHGGRNLSPV